MKIRNKIYWSVGLVLPGTGLYYLTFVSVDKLFSKWCKTNYCFEFPPYADTLAIYVAVVGLYFVVTSLNEWKIQEKYFKSKANFEILSEMCSFLESIDNNLLDLKLTDFAKMKTNSLEFINFIGHGNTASHLNSCLNFNLKKVEKRNNKLDDEKERIVNKSNGLYQEEINEIFSEYSRIISKATIEFKKEFIEKGNNIMEDYQKELEALYTTFHHDIDNLSIKLKKLEEDLNDFLDG